jgi:hypothetical protein
MSGPPGKREGALLQAPIPKLTGALEYRACPHSSTYIEPTLGYIHHGAVRCAACRKFMGWVAKPQTLERRRLNSFKLAKLAMVDALSDWERSFVANVLPLRRLSPKQQAIIDRLCATYLQEAA